MISFRRCSKFTRVYCVYQTPYIPGQPLPESTKAPPLPRGSRKKKDSVSSETKAGLQTAGASARAESIKSSSGAKSESRPEPSRRTSAIASSHMDSKTSSTLGQDAFSPRRASSGPSPYSVLSTPADEDMNRMSKFDLLSPSFFSLLSFPAEPHFRPAFRND